MDARNGQARWHRHCVDVDVCARPLETAFAVGTESAPPPSAAQVDAASAPPPKLSRTGRNQPLPVDEKPADVVDGSLKARGKSPNSKLRVVSVVNADGKPVISTKTVTGAAAARKVVASAQKNPNLLSVELDVAQHLLVTKSRLHRRAPNWR